MKRRFSEIFLLSIMLIIFFLEASPFNIIYFPKCTKSNISDSGIKSSNITIKDTNFDIKDANLRIVDINSKKIKVEIIDIK